MYHVFNQSESNTLPVTMYISARYIALSPSGHTPSQFAHLLEHGILEILGEYPKISKIPCSNRCANCDGVRPKGGSLC